MLVVVGKPIAANKIGTTRTLYGNNRNNNINNKTVTMARKNAIIIMNLLFI